MILWVAIQVRVGGGGGVFFGHMRIGQNGVPFPCYKFRTMAVNADVLIKELLANDPHAREEWQRDFKLKNDPRVTKIGRFLRKTSLDELRVELIDRLGTLPDAARNLLQIAVLRLKAVEGAFPPLF